MSNSLEKISVTSVFDWLCHSHLLSVKDREQNEECILQRIGAIFAERYPTPGMKNVGQMSAKEAKRTVEAVKEKFRYNPLAPDEYFYLPDPNLHNIVVR